MVRPSCICIMYQTNVSAHKHTGVTMIQVIHLNDTSKTLMISSTYPPPPPPGRVIHRNVSTMYRVLRRCARYVHDTHRKIPKLFKGTIYYIMKLLLENWKRYINENTNNIWYHTTSPTSVDSIMKHGLKVDSQFNKSLSSQFYIKEIYGLNPLYVSKEEGRYKNGVILAVDVSGISLVTDIPTLISDYYAQLGESLDHIWFEEDYTPFEMFDFVDGNGAIYFEDLLDPNSRVTKAMIDLTGTAAIMQDIPPQRIKVIGNV